ncbi:MAG: histidine kinase [Myxococcales bacterium]|nr:histidine kinase [Myxococcales bacterium]
MTNTADAPLLPRPPRKEPRANLFSTVLDAMADGVLVVDDQVNVVVTNRALRDLLVLPPATHGRPLASVLPEPRLRAAYVRALHAGEASRVEFEHRGMQSRVLDVAVVPLPDHAYWGHRALGVFRDVTTQRALDRMLMDFIANASHELRTPVSAILGWSETLVDAPPQRAEALQRVHATIHRNAVHLSDLVAHLLDLRRLDAAEWHLETTAVDVRDVFNLAVAQHAAAAAEAGLSVKITLPATLPPVKADRAALDVVVGNLVQNAIRYTPAGGRIELRARVEPGRRVRVLVTDSGIGIAEADQTRVFERFYRVDPGRSRHTGGVGLGLSIVKALVDRLGGELELSSRVGKGSTFAVVLTRA